MATNAGDAAMRSSNRASAVRKLRSPDSEPATGGADSLEALRPLIVCPACRAEDIRVDATGNALQCPKCSVRFPAFRSGTSDVPWLFAEPSTTRLEWKARYNGFLHANASEQERLRKALGENRNSIAGRRRINRLLKGRKAHREQVT